LRPEIIDTRGWADDDQKIKTGHINTVGALDKLFRNRYWTRKEFRNWCEKIFGVDEMATHRWCRKWGVVWDEKGELAFVTLRRVYEDDPLVKMVRQSHRKALPAQKGAPPPAPEPSGGLQSEVARQIALLDEIARTAPRIADRNSAIREKSLLLGLHREDVQDKLARETSSTESDVERCRRIGLNFREALGLPTDDLPAAFKKIIEETDALRGYVPPVSGCVDNRPKPDENNGEKPSGGGELVQCLQPGRPSDTPPRD
jgi:hypothetical protein